MHVASEEFETIVRRILQARNFVIEESPVDEGFDFIARLGNEDWAIEAKYYRTVRPQVALLEAAAQKLISRARRYQAQRGMLIVSCILPPELLSHLENRFSLTLVDRAQLLAWVTEIPELLDQLSALLDAEPSELKPPPERRTRPSPEDLRYLSAPLEPEGTRGTTLCARLRKLKRGKPEWPEYERLSEKILKYLFPNDLHGWHKQKTTDDGLNRFDYVCRIRPTTEFWRFVVEHLSSRYAVFEFKNYGTKIKQGQVLTTEKYLLERGFRRVAIMLTRLGADKSAEKMTRGAMREHGKLILVLNDDHVCEMLHMRERGEDPSDFLFELTDDFLLRLAR
ncbi:MAG: restriction endonuclease [Fimbriimonadaceae bacterium]|nr:restriction endonuclease [Fimbriimonadaceae bacterium]